MKKVRKTKDALMAIAAFLGSVLLLSACNAAPSKAERPVASEVSEEVAVQDSLKSAAPEMKQSPVKGEPPMTSSDMDLPSKPGETPTTEVAEAVSNLLEISEVSTETESREAVASSELQETPTLSADSETLAVTGSVKTSAPAETPASTAPTETRSSAQEYGKQGSWNISSGKRENVIRLWKQRHPDEAFLRVSDVDTWYSILDDLSQNLPEDPDFLSEAERNRLRNRYDREFFEQNDLILCEVTMGESTYGITSVGTVAEAGRFTLVVNLLTPPVTKDEIGGYVAMSDAEQYLDFFIEMEKQCSSELEFFEAVAGKIEAAENMEQYQASKVGK